MSFGMMSFGAMVGIRTTNYNVIPFLEHERYNQNVGLCPSKYVLQQGTPHTLLYNSQDQSRWHTMSKDNSFPYGCNPLVSKCRKLEVEHSRSYAHSLKPNDGHYYMVDTIHMMCINLEVIRACPIVPLL